MKDVLHHDAIFDDAKLKYIAEVVLQMRTSQLETFVHDLLAIVKQRREEERKQQAKKHLAAIYEHTQALQNMNLDIVFELDDGPLHIWHDDKEFTVGVTEPEPEPEAW